MRVNASPITCNSLSTALVNNLEETNAAYVDVLKCLELFELESKAHIAKIKENN